jgi:hypothetical protein
MFNKQPLGRPKSILGGSVETSKDKEVTQMEDKCIYDRKKWLKLCCTSNPSGKVNR